MPSDMVPSETVNIRYLVDDVEASIDWYSRHLGFTVLTNYAPAFADVAHGSLRLLLSGPTSSAARPMSDGAQPRAGGWNRIHLIVDDLAAEVARLKAEGAQFRNDMVKGPAARRSCSSIPRAISSSCSSRQGANARGHSTRRWSMLHNPRLRARAKALTVGGPRWGAFHQLRGGSHDAGLGS